LLNFFFSLFFNYLRTTFLPSKQTFFYKTLMYNNCLLEFYVGFTDVEQYVIFVNKLAVLNWCMKSVWLRFEKASLAQWLCIVIKICDSDMTKRFLAERVFSLILILYFISLYNEMRSILSRTYRLGYCHFKTLYLRNWRTYVYTAVYTEVNFFFNCEFLFDFISYSSEFRLQSLLTCKYQLLYLSILLLTN